MISRAALHAEVLSYESMKRYSLEQINNILEKYQYLSIERCGDIILHEALPTLDAVRTAYMSSGSRVLKTIHAQPAGPYIALIV